jgi:hypothetical protein
VSNQPWAGKLLSILHQATQHEPAERYATVEAFWQELATLTHVSGEAKEEVDDEATVIPGGIASRRILESPPPSVSTAAARPSPASDGSPVVRVEVPVQPVMPPPNEKMPVAAQRADSIPPTDSVVDVEIKPSNWRRRVFATGLAAGFVAATFWVHAVVSGIGTRTLLTGVVTAVNLNLREKPTTSSSVVGVIPKDMRVKVLRMSSDNLWLEVETDFVWDVQEQGWHRARGWVSKSYIKLDGGQGR